MLSALLFVSSMVSATSFVCQPGGRIARLEGRVLTWGPSPLALDDEGVYSYRLEVPTDWGLKQADTWVYRARVAAVDGARMQMALETYFRNGGNGAGGTWNENYDCRRGSPRP